MANYRWPADKNVQFITEYKRHECLWDPNHFQYKNRGVRTAAYQNILETMGMETIKDVISKIRILRNTYNNELLKARKMSAEIDEVYVSKIPWLSHMDFLQQIDTRENSSYLQKVC